MIAQYGDNAPAVSLGINNKNPGGGIGNLIKE